jgi:dTDP-4-amino-4,6-dideoxygalactose transaminase
MRNFGFSGLDNVIYSGTNGKMIEIAAAMGLVNLEAIGDFIDVNRNNYETYRLGLEDLPGITVLPFDDCESNNYQYVVMEVSEECPVNRDQIIERLHANNILARKYFWPGCHNMKPYRELYPHAGLVLPNTKRVADRVIVLPTGTGLTVQMVKTVTQVIREHILD